MEALLLRLDFDASPVKPENRICALFYHHHHHYYFT